MVTASRVSTPFNPSTSPRGMKDMDCNKFKIQCYVRTAGLLNLNHWELLYWCLQGGTRFKQQLQKFTLVDEKLKEQPETLSVKPPQQAERGIGIHRRDVYINISLTIKICTSQKKKRNSIWATMWKHSYIWFRLLKKLDRDENMQSEEGKERWQNKINKYEMRV